MDGLCHEIRLSKEFRLSIFLRLETLQGSDGKGGEHTGGERIAFPEYLVSEQWVLRESHRSLTGKF